MADPNAHNPDHHDPEQTSQNTSIDSLGIDFNAYDDPPSAENIMKDEAVAQLVLQDKQKLLNENADQIGQGTSQTGPFGGVNDQHNENVWGDLNRDFSNFGNPTRLGLWPAPAQPYNCSCCQVLREIIHTIDGESRKFEIHGRVGEIFHGILEICDRNVNPPHKEYQMFDFCKETIPDVKAFLVQYCEDRTNAGYTMVKDPLLEFNEALNIGSDWEYGPDADEFPLELLMDIDENIGQRNEKGSKGKGKLVVDERGSKGKGKLVVDEKGSKGKGKLGVNEASKKVSKKAKGKGKRIYKEQRAFISQLSVQDFVDYFHLPRYAAAEKYSISSGALGNVCKRQRFTWPYEKVQENKKQIERNRVILNSSANAKEKGIAEAEIIKLEQEIVKYLTPPPPKSKED